MSRKMLKLICQNCEKEFERPKSQVESEIRKRKSQEFYCSLSCFRIYRNLTDLHSFKNPDARLKAIKSHYPNEYIYKEKVTKKRPKFNFLNYIFYKIQKRKKYNIDINLKCLEELWQKQDGKCAISNVPLLLWEKKKDKNKPDTASLDRIDSDLGYQLYELF